MYETIINGKNFIGYKTWYFDFVVETIRLCGGGGGGERDV